MKRTIRPGGLAVLLLFGNAVSGLAGDSVKYQFNGWTVTVTPRRTSRLATGPAGVTINQRLSPSIPTGVVDTNESSGLVRQVSMQQEAPAAEPVAAPAPTPEDVAPRLKSTVEPMSVGPVPPSPVVNQFSSVPQGYRSQLPVIIPRPRVEPANPPAFVPQTALYRDIYASIPFNRAEYDYYPNYRHDATMELLFNQMRPTIMQRSPLNVVQPGLNSGFGYSNGFPYTYPYQPYYPFSYGLRIHRSP